MIRDLMNGNDNHNYLVGNLLLGDGTWGDIVRAVTLDNRVGNRNIHADKLSNVEPYIVPWYPIPVDRIGTYKLPEHN